ncbi:uroporphyrinogen-III decarboxylase-like protein, partial [bacterium]|nr:uroporphyrinogen-III decarboxylase-like protein [bacterium]
CMTMYDDEQLIYDIFEKVGSGLAEYYAQCGKSKNVLALISNDDWGFHTQTMLSPVDMRKFVFPWHKKIVETIHDSGKYAILHSCGNYSMILDDLYALNYDARHSYEDKIEPVEQALLRFHGKLAVLGGIDLNFIINSTEEEITQRAKNLIEQGQKLGGYALGTGNSVPSYVPDKNYFVMLRAVGLDF